MIRFEFELRPLDQVAPWGSDEPKLHWFGLTDGWYWITGPDCEFLRYTDKAVREWELERPYPDYYVVRLWEELIVLRWVLEAPVPEDLVQFVDGSFEQREFPDDDWGPEVDAAFDLRSDHNIYMGALTNAPTLTCWRESARGSDTVTLSQRILPSEQGTFAGPARLDIVVPSAEFFAAVEAFDQRLIAAMEERVTELERTGPPNGVALDVRQLRAEHTQRKHWLEKRLATPRQVDWPKVRAGAAEISRWPLLQPDQNG